MKLLKPISLTEDLIHGHDFYVQIDPFYAQSLVEVLKYLQFKIDPALDEIAKILPEFDRFGYRTQSRRIRPNSRGKIEFYDAYHEGFHNLVGLRFGTELRHRPKMTLLNECMGIALEGYTVAQLVLATNFKLISSTGPLPKIIKNAQILGEPFKKRFARALRNPFAVYRETAHEAYTLHKSVYEALTKYEGRPHAWVRSFLDEMKTSHNQMFFFHADVTLPGLFVAHNCGAKSNLTDLRDEQRCLNLLEKSKSMDDFLVKLGIEKYLPRRELKSA